MFSVTKAFSYIIYIYHILSLQPGSSPAVNFIQKSRMFDLQTFCFLFLIKNPYAKFPQSSIHSSLKHSV
jgi:hypothetical protein